MTILALLIGLAVGALAVYLWARTALTARDQLREQLLAAAEATLAQERAAAAERLALVERGHEQWEERIKAATGDALTRSQTSLLELTEAKLAPIKETLTKFESQARALEEHRLRAVTAVGEQLRVVAEGQERLRNETGSLVTALRAPHVRGRWGEVQLKRVVELAGMLDYCDFRTQESTRDDEGRLLRPDLVVKLPGGKSIVVDSKVPIEAYLDALNCEDPELKRVHLARHAAQMRDHIGKLGEKRYWRQFDPSPEIVVMFVDEGLYRAALDQDGSLFEVGAESGVIVASPATLIGLLRTIAYGWQQETVAESARAISSLGRELYERLGVFAGHFAKVGRGLDTAVGAFNQAVSSFETRLLVTARKFPEHGVTNDVLPETPQIERKPVQLTAPELVPDEPVTLRRADADAA
ncbi:MAG TPA: DNA recombination protein RmuC [Gaiellaceae bacterium]|jgi:DNA recombination protein RmuC|nr:DNA recombination protein RmuC [Gaiellaceae bacterium]